MTVTSETKTRVKRTPEELIAIAKEKLAKAEARAEKAKVREARKIENRGVKLANHADRVAARMEKALAILSSVKGDDRADEDLATAAHRAATIINEALGARCADAP
jgi:hypothetical protein